MIDTLHDSFDEQTEAECITLPRIYVACLASYNSGVLHGDWVEAAQDIDELRESVKSIIDSSPTVGAKEWAIHDSENFGDIEIDETESLERVARIADGIVKHGPLFSVVAVYYGGDLDETEEALRERYAGGWDSLESFAEEQLMDSALLEKVPQALRIYLDIAAYGRDMELSGDIRAFQVGDLVHIIRMH